MIGGPVVFSWPGSFLLYNTHSLPVRGDEIYTPLQPRPVSAKRRFLADESGHEFAFRYTDITGADFTRDILKTSLPFEFISPRHELADPWNAPAFFADSRHVFLVTSEEQRVPVRDYGGFGILDTLGVLEGTRLPALVTETAPPARPKFWGDGGPIGGELGAVDTAAMQRFVTEDANIHQGLSITDNVRYGDRQIGPSGSNGSAER
jgi:hypothetical protein